MLRKSSILCVVTLVLSLAKAAEGIIWACIGADGGLCFAGSSDGPGWPLRNPLHTTFAGGPGAFGAADCIVGRLIPAGHDGDHR